ncbi:MAG: hypothetical protein ACFCGT_23455 [Sandaracinaceae bacterium]
MRTREDIQAYLARSGHPHRELDDQTWLVSDPSETQDHVVVRLTSDLVLFRMKILEMESIDPARKAEFLEKILHLNAEDMVHGAYGITDGDLVITATFRLENLDFSEFSSTLDDFSLAVTNHYPILRDFRSAAA